MISTQSASQKRKRHTVAEISTKLTKAAELAAAGAIQKDIAESLGISVMTYHRWRRSFHQLALTEELTERTSTPIGLGEAARAAELQLENSLLRRLVTDLLLEKVQLEEQAGQSQPVFGRATGTRRVIG